LGELAELELEFFWGVDPLLHQQGIHGIHRRPEAFFTRQFLHSLIEADEIFGSRYRILGPINRWSRHRIPQRPTSYAAIDSMRSVFSFGADDET